MWRTGCHVSVAGGAAMAATSSRVAVLPPRCSMSFDSVTDACSCCDEQRWDGKDHARAGVALTRSRLAPIRLHEKLSDDASLCERKIDGLSSLPTDPREGRSPHVREGHVTVALRSLVRSRGARG